jgi:hypothetical protein
MGKAPDPGGNGPGARLVEPRGEIRRKGGTSRIPHSEGEGGCPRNTENMGRILSGFNPEGAYRL